MIIRLRLRVAGQEAATDTIRIDDAKLEQLADEEREAAVEVAIRTWTDRNLEIDWETEDEPD
jgi:hypothetical protein